MTRRFAIPLVAALLAPSALLAQKPTTKPAPATPAPRASVAAPATPAPAPAPQPAQPLASRATDFSRVDAYADAAPASAAQSVAALAAYLAGAGPDELTRARALFRWIARNIAYNVDGLRSGQYGDLSPDGVLRSRSSVCEGYSRLGEAIGTAMGLRVQVVSGWSKGYGYTPGQRFEGRTNHAWNAVWVDGAWRLMDATWGAGYLDEQMRFARRFQEHYFLTAPEAFVFDHLPEDPRWQLLERPVSAEEYAGMAYVRPTFWLLGFRVGSHPNVRIETGERLTVSLGVTRPVQVSAAVVDPGTNRRVEGDYTLVQVGDTAARVDAVFPRAGDYLLRIFAKPRGAEGSLGWVMDYRVSAARGAADAAFPTVYGAFGARSVELYEPVAGLLQAGHAYRFRLRVPDALDVAVVVGGTWTHLARSGDEWSGEVTAGAGDVTVYAKYDPASNFTGLLRYTGR